MTTNMAHYVVNTEKVLFPDESFQVAGVCFYAQNRLGRFAKEKQYVDIMEARFIELGIPCRRELVAGTTGNRVDLIVYDRILVEVKAKPFLNQDDYAQVQRYLQVLHLDLGLLVNFWARSAQPHRILKQHMS
jgi:GxxExxY protein